MSAKCELCGGYRDESCVCPGCHEEKVNELIRQTEQARERVAMEIEGLMLAHIGRHQTAYVMQLWREMTEPKI